MTGLELINAACEICGVKSPADGALSGPDAEMALTHANLMRKTWNGLGLALTVTQRVSYTWTADQATRTIGLAGQLVGTRPERILAAKVIPVGQTTEQPVNLLSHVRAYAAIPNKAQTATYFTDLLYERTGSGIGTLTVWPVPTSAPTLILHHQGQYAAFTLDDEISVDEAAEPALVSSLAKRLAGVFRVAWSRENEETYRQDWATFQGTNLRVPDEVRMPAGLPGTRAGVPSQRDYDAGRC